MLLLLLWLPPALPCTLQDPRVFSPIFYLNNHPDLEQVAVLAVSGVAGRVSHGGGCGGPLVLPGGGGGAPGHRRLPQPAVPGEVPHYSTRSTWSTCSTWRGARLDTAPGATYSRYPDLAAQFGADYTLAVQHYLEQVL